MLGRLGQYGTFNPYSNFKQDAVDRYAAQFGSASRLDVQRQAMERLWKEQYNNYLSRINTRIAAMKTVTDPVVREDMTKRAEQLRHRLELRWEVISNVASMVNSPLFIIEDSDYLYSDSELKAEYNGFESNAIAINKTYEDMLKVERSVPDLLAQSKQRAANARAMMSEAALDELRAKAGDADYYFAQLANQYYLEQLAAVHSRELGPDVMSHINDLMKSNKVYLEQSKPTIIDTFKIPDVPGFGASLFGGFGDIAKWGVMIGGGAVILMGILASKGIKKLRRA